MIKRIEGQEECPLPERQVGPSLRAKVLGSILVFFVGTLPTLRYVLAGLLYDGDDLCQHLALAGPPCWMIGVIQAIFMVFLIIILSILWGRRD